MSDVSEHRDERDIEQRRSAALKHAVILGLVSLGFLALFILRTTAGR